MDNNIFRQIPFIRGNHTCPVCSNPVAEYKTLPVELHSLDRTKVAVCECKLLYCSNCKIPLVDGDLLRTIRQAHNEMRVSTFTPRNKCTAFEVNVQLYQIRNSPSIPCLQGELNGRISIFVGKASYHNTHRVLYSFDGKTTVCRSCQAVLRGDEAIIPIGNQKIAVVRGKYCDSCRRLYIKDKPAVDKLLRDNPYARGFYLNGRALWNATAVAKQQEEKRKIKKLTDIPSSVLLLHIRFAENTPTEIIIVSSKDAAVPTSGIYYYASVEGRELITAAFCDNRAGSGSIDGNKFSVIGTPVFKDEGQETLPEHILATQVYFEVDGGYISSVRNSRRKEIVDLLMYSPFTRRYEIIRATHDKNSEECYIDFRLYRDFARKYGNPELPNYFRGSHNSFEWDDLREESNLKKCGYTTAKAEGLSTKSRQDLLADVVDLKLYTVAQIVRLIDFNIRRHPQEKYFENRVKWELDKKFIQNYDVNPSRFLIAKSPYHSKRSDY